eukprot:596620-Pelagomonas_calceolata.AAC.1
MAFYRAKLGGMHGAITPAPTCWNAGLAGSGPVTHSHCSTRVFLYTILEDQWEVMDSRPVLAILKLGDQNPWPKWNMQFRAVLDSKGLGD